MAWAAITPEDVRTGLSATELEALSSIDLADGQSDPLPEVIQQVTDEIRGYIAAQALNTLGPAGTLPPQARAAAIALIRWRYAGRLAVGKAGELLRSDTRKAEMEDGQRLIRDISTGKCVVEAPPSGQEGPEVIPELTGQWGSSEKVDF